MEKFAINDKILFKMAGNPIISRDDVVRPEVLAEGKIFEVLPYGEYGIELLTALPPQEQGVCLNEYLPPCPGIAAGTKIKIREEKILEKII